MKHISTQGILIHKYPVGEQDTIATWYTREHGRLKTKVRGAKKITSKFMGHIEYFNVCNLTIYQNKKSMVLTECETNLSFSKIKANLQTVNHGFEIIKLLNRITYDDNEQEELFMLLLEILTIWEHQPENELVLQGFKLKLLDYLGFSPQFIECSLCHKKFSTAHHHFLSNRGNLICHSCGQSPIPLTTVDIKNLKLSHYITQASLTKLTNISISKSELQNFRKFIDQLYQLHYPELSS